MLFQMLTLVSLHMIQQTTTFALKIQVLFCWVWVVRQSCHSRPINNGRNRKTTKILVYQHRWLRHETQSMPRSSNRGRLTLEVVTRWLLFIHFLFQTTLSDGLASFPLFACVHESFFIQHRNLMMMHLYWYFCLSWGFLCAYVLCISEFTCMCTFILSQKQWIVARRDPKCDSSL